MMTADSLPPMSSSAGAGAAPERGCAWPRKSPSEASNCSVASWSLATQASTWAAAQFSHTRHCSTLPPLNSGCRMAPFPLGLGAGELQHLRNADQGRGGAQRVGGAMPRTHDSALRAGEPQTHEQLQDRRVDLLDPGAVDDDGPAFRKPRQQRAMQIRGLHNRDPGAELNACVRRRARRFRGSRLLLLAHAAATAGRSSSEMLLPMSLSMSSRMSIFSSMVARALTNTVSTPPHTSGGGLVSAASTL